MTAMLKYATVKTSLITSDHINEVALLLETSVIKAIGLKHWPQTGHRAVTCSKIKLLYKRNLDKLAITKMYIN